MLEHQRAITDSLQRRLGLVCPYVFHREGRAIKSFRTEFRTACAEAGCPGRLLHDFRRTAVRNLVRAGIPERVAMQLTGHKTRSVFERYNIVSAGDLRDAAKRIDATGASSQNPHAGSRSEFPQIHRNGRRTKGAVCLVAAPRLDRRDHAAPRIAPSLSTVERLGPRLARAPISRRSLRLLALC